MSFDFLLPADVSRRDTTLAKTTYALDATDAEQTYSRTQVQRMLSLRVAETRRDIAAVNTVWRERHYLGGHPTPPRVKRISYIGQLGGADTGPAVCSTIACMPSGSVPFRALLRELQLHPCSVLELVRCWRADNLTPVVAPGLMLVTLRRIVSGGNGVGSLHDEWSRRKLTNGLVAPPLVLITYADPAVGHDGGLYSGAGAVSIGETANGKSCFAWGLTPDTHAAIREMGPVW